jgi:hypothetical protein
MKVIRVIDLVIIVFLSLIFGLIIWQQKFIIDKYKTDLDVAQQNFIKVNKQKDDQIKSLTELNNDLKEDLQLERDRSFTAHDDILNTLAPYLPECPPVSKIKVFIEKRFSAWVSAWKKEVPGFAITKFKKSVVTINYMSEDVYNDKNVFRRELYINSPDNKRSIDIFVGAKLKQHDIKAQVAFDSDTGVGLLNIKTQVFKRLAYGSPEFHYDDAVWLDNNTVIIVGHGDFTGNKNHTPFIQMYRLFGDVVKSVSYTGPALTDSNRINRIMSHFHKKRFPNLVF